VFFFFFFFFQNNCCSHLKTFQSTSSYSPSITSSHHNIPYCPSSSISREQSPPPSINFANNSLVHNRFTPLPISLSHFQIGWVFSPSKIIPEVEQNLEKKKDFQFQPIVYRSVSPFSFFWRGAYFIIFLCMCIFFFRLFLIIYIFSF
jgi:hypothetical protein